MPGRWKIPEKRAQRSLLFARTKYMNVSNCIIGKSTQVCFKIQKLVSLWGSMASGLTLTLVRDIFVAMNDNHDDRKIIDMEKNNGPLYGRRAKNCRCSFCMFMSVGFCPSSFKFFLLRTATSRTS